MWRSNSLDPAAQERWRKWALSAADYIIPGHGPPFKVTAQHRATISADNKQGEYLVVNQDWGEKEMAACVTLKSVNI